jgi:hypothetical protein
MEFLKDVLGEDLYRQFTEKVNAYNEDEANKDKQIKLANLAGGEYVGKGKHDSLQAQLDGKITELKSANDLIAELRKAEKNNEGVQSKITAYEQQVQQLQAQLNETRINAAIKLALVEAKALDTDYLSFKLESKLKEDNKQIELDENGNIKGWDNIISGLKTQYPTQFETGAGNGKNVMEHKLDHGNSDDKLTRESILKMPYAQRAELAEKDPEGYAAAMHS